MPREFFPFVEEEQTSDSTQDSPDGEPIVKYPARIAVYDDPSVTPRVVVIEPMDVRDYLAEITKAVTNLAKEQGGTIPFTIIREIVENFIHAAFIEPTITILDGGNTIRFCDQGPGIKEKDKALQFGTTSATDGMKHYIRGVGSGLPIAQQYMLDKGGSLTIQDNISSGTIVTISTRPKKTAEIPIVPHQNEQQMPELQNYQQVFGQPQFLTQMNQNTNLPAQMCQQNPDYMMEQQGAMPNYPAQPTTPQWVQQAYPGMNGFEQGSQTQATTWPNGAQFVPQISQAAQINPMFAANNVMQPQGVANVTQNNIAAPTMGGNDVLHSLMTLQLTQRQKQALAALSQFNLIGGKQLADQYGGSAPTWSRELSQLDTLGITIKDGQKRKLTEIGKAYVQVLNNMQ